MVEAGMGDSWQKVQWLSLVSGFPEYDLKFPQSASGIGHLGLTDYIAIKSPFAKKVLSSALQL